MGEKKLLSAADILAKDDVEVVDVEVPEWGGTVRLQGLTGAEAAHFVDVIAKDKSGSAVKIVAMSCVDENGYKLFSEEQVERLKEKSLKALMRLQREAMRLNGLTEEALAATKND